MSDLDFFDRLLFCTIVLLFVTVVMITVIGIIIFLGLI